MKLAILIVAVNLGQHVSVAVAPQPVYVNLGQSQHPPIPPAVVRVNLGQK